MKDLEALMPHYKSEVKVRLEIRPFLILIAGFEAWFVRHYGNGRVKVLHDFHLF